MRSSFQFQLAEWSVRQRPVLGAAVPLAVAGGGGRRRRARGRWVDPGAPYRAPQSTKQKHHDRPGLPTANTSIGGHDVGTDHVHTG